MVVGTTIGINAVLTRSGARVVFLTTKGFEDIPFIQRISRKHHYDYRWRKPTPLVRRPDCVGVDGTDRRGGAHRRPAERRGAESGGRQPAARRRPRGDRRLLPLLLSRAGARACHARRTRRNGPAGLALARGGPDLARVRARNDRNRRCVPQAAARGLRGRAFGRARRPGHPEPVLTAQVERRSRACGAGGAAARPPPPLRDRRRGDRRGSLRAARRHGRRGRARHGRHELRRLPDRRRRAPLLLGLRDRVRLPRQRARREHEDDRRRRRLDRLDRPWRLPPGRPAERGR